MNESLLNRILKDHKRRTRSLALILCLSMIVSLGTFAGFHKNAIAKVYTREVLDCPYAREGAEPVAHVHNDDCYDGETLVCTLPEREAHTHDDTCYAESRMLSCGLEENPGHQHSEACFDENGELTCQIPEGEGAHVHTDACYTIERALICNQPELPVHVHDAGCFRTEEITVDEPEETAASEQAVSTVPEMPVSDPNADLETADDWNREFENLELSGNWARDLVLVAATQQGRGESPNNFEAVLNDAGDAWVRHGYTRYGAWYGYPYAEWDAMFVSFCLRYAGIPVENVPNNPTAAFMAESFSMGGLFAGRDYVPAVGDLIFFDTVDDEVTNIDHMGIVYHVDAENGTINTVEGDRTDAVATFGYYLNDEQIIGYGILPQNPDYIPVEGENTDNTDEAFDGFIFMTTDEEEEKQEETTTAEDVTAAAVPMPAQSWERTAGGIKVSVEAPEGAFPENTRIAVTPVNGSSLKDTVSDAVDGEVLEVQAVDITFFDSEGREIEPAVPIRVVMTPAATEHAEEKTNVVHVDIAQQTAELIEQAEGTEADNSEVVFDADAFTIYAIVYTYQVEYEYEVDGKTFTSSMPGAEDMPLSEIVKGLGIVGEEELETFLSKIASVTSTNEEVAVVTEDRSVRVLKDGDAQIVITMQDGAAFSISVEAEGVTEISDENEVATVSTVNDLYLPAAGEVKAELLTEEKSENAIAAVQTATESEENSAAAESASYQAFSIALENVDVTAYDGFNVAVTLPEDAVVGRDFQLYQVREDGTATDLTESLTVTGEPNEDGLQNVSGISFTTEDFADFVLSYSIETFYTTAGGDTYRITLNYGPKAGIPDGAALKVSEILPEDESYTNYLNESAAKLGVESGAVSFARFFDIEIKKDGEKIEPLTPVQMSISLTDAPAETAPEALKVVHFAEAGPETIDETQAAQKEDASVELIFDAESFSVYGVIVEPINNVATDLDGKTAKIGANGRYLIADTNYSQRPWAIKKTGDVNQAAEYTFEATGTSGVYNIYTLIGDTKYYIHINHADGDPSWNGGANANGSVNLTETGSMGLNVSQQPDGSYRIYRTINGTNYYLNEHNGENGPGFATYTDINNENSIINLTFTTPVLGNNKEYMVVVKQGDAYYIVLNDGTLTSVEYNEEDNSVTVDNPMLWYYTGDHLYHDSTQVGYNNQDLPSDSYFRYIDPSAKTALNEDDATNTTNDGTATGNGAGPKIISRSLWNTTALTYVDNRLESSSNPDYYVGVVREGGTLKLKGQVSESEAATIFFADAVNVDPVGWQNHVVNHIDISIRGTAAADVPLAYGKYYDANHNVKLDVTSFAKIHLTEDEVVDQNDLEVTPEDMKRSTISAYLENGTNLNDMFYVAGYSANPVHEESTAQVRIEGAFKVANLDGTDYEVVDTGLYNQSQWNQSANNGQGARELTNDAIAYRALVHNARLNNRIHYSVTVIKPITFNLVYTESVADPNNPGESITQKTQLYDADGNPLTITADVAFSASFDYWDERNECPPIHDAAYGYHEQWQNGGIPDHNLSGMDFKLGADSETTAKVYAVEITKIVVDENGNRIKSTDAGTNTFYIYKNSDGVSAMTYDSAVTSYVQPDYDDVKDLDIGSFTQTPDYSGYSLQHEKTISVGSEGLGLVYDYDVQPGRYYIKEDPTSIIDQITDISGKTWDYKNTYILTEYAWRNHANDNYMHVSDTFTKKISGEYEAADYSGIPEILGLHYGYNGTDGPYTNDFLEFYVYNVYESPKVDVPVIKTWVDFEGNEYNWTTSFKLQWAPLYEGEARPSVSFQDVTPTQTMTINKSDMAGITQELINRYLSGDTTLTQQEIDKIEAITFKNLPKYGTDSNGNTFRYQYSLEETSYRVINASTGVILYSWSETDGYNDPDESTHYHPFYPHDAGETEEGNTAEENEADTNYYVDVTNALRNISQKEYIDVTLDKQWDINDDGTPDTRDETCWAEFELRRFVHTEHRDLSHMSDSDRVADPITITIQDSAGNTIHTLQVQPNVGLYLGGNFLPHDSEKTVTFTSDHPVRLANDSRVSTLTVTAAGENQSNALVRSQEFFATQNTVFTISSGTENLVTGNLARVLDTGAGTSPLPDRTYSQTIRLDNSNNWQVDFEDLIRSETSSGDDDDNENVTFYEYYLVEQGSNPKGYAQYFRADSEGNITTVLSGDSDHQIEHDDSIIAVNGPSNRLIVKKLWRGVPDTTGFPAVTFTLYQAWADGNEGWVYVNDRGESYQKIELKGNSLEWICPETLPTTKLDGSTSRAVKYYVVEDVREGSETKGGITTSWKFYYYINSKSQQTNAGHQGYFASLNGLDLASDGGTITICNEMNQYMQLDIQKQFFKMEEAGSWNNVTASSEMMRNAILGFKVIRAIKDPDGKWLDERGNESNTPVWMDYGEEMLCGYDENGQTVVHRGENDIFWLHNAGGDWHFRIEDNQGDATNVNAGGAGLPSYGFYIKNGEDIPVEYWYSVRETSVYKDLNRTPYPEWDWFSSITPVNAYGPNGQTMEAFPKAFHGQDAKRIANFQASDLIIDKEWIGTPAASAVYVKIWRTSGSGTPEDFTAIMAEDIRNNHNWQMYVNDPAEMDLNRNALILKPDSEGKWENAIKVNRTLLGALSETGEYHYYIQEVGYRTAGGEYRTNVNGTFKPLYDKWTGTATEGAYTGAPVGMNDYAGNNIKIGAKGENRLKVINSTEPSTSYTVTKAFHGPQSSTGGQSSVTGKYPTDRSKQVVVELQQRYRYEKTVEEGGTAVKYVSADHETWVRADSAEAANIWTVDWQAAESASPVSVALPLDKPAGSILSDEAWYGSAAAWTYTWEGLDVQKVVSQAANPEDSLIAQLYYRAVETSTPDWFNSVIAAEEQNGHMAVDDGSQTTAEVLAEKNTITNEREDCTLELNKEWTGLGEGDTWPSGYVVYYQLIQNFHLATAAINGDTVTYSYGETIKSVDMVTSYSDGLTADSVHPRAVSTLEENNHNLTLTGLPMYGFFTATEEDVAAAAEKGVTLTAGTVYPVVYTYSVKETRVTKDNVDVDFTEQTVDFTEKTAAEQQTGGEDGHTADGEQGTDSQTETTETGAVYEATLTNEMTSVDVTKTWADGKPYADSVTVKLYRVAEPPVDDSCEVIIKLSFDSNYDQVTSDTITASVDGTSVTLSRSGNSNLWTGTVKLEKNSTPSISFTAPAANEGYTVTLNKQQITVPDADTGEVQVHGTVSAAQAGRTIRVTLDTSAFSTNNRWGFWGPQINENSEWPNIPVGGFLVDDHEAHTVQFGVWGNFPQNIVLTLGDVSLVVTGGKTTIQYTVPAGNADVTVTGSAVQNGESGGTSGSTIARITHDEDITIEGPWIDLNNLLVGQEYSVSMNIKGINPNNVLVTVSGAEASSECTNNWGDGGGKWTITIKPTNENTPVVISISRAQQRTLSFKAPMFRTAAVAPSSITVNLLHENADTSLTISGKDDYPEFTADNLVDTKALTANNNWHYEWEGLPSRDPETGAKYHYYVVEEIPENTKTVTYSRTESEANGSTTVIINNEPVVNPKYGRITVTKRVLEKGTDTTLDISREFTIRLKQGDKFLQYTNESTYQWVDEENSTTWTFNNGGSVIFTGLDLGTYTVVEDTGTNMIEIEGYQFDSDDSITSVSVTLSDDKLEESAEIKNYYELSSVPIDIVKVDSTNRTKKLTGAKFQMTRSDGSKYVVFENEAFEIDQHTQKHTGPFTITEEKGITINDLSPGTYEVKELEPPEGYVVSSNTFHFTIENDGTVSYTEGDNSLVSFKLNSDETNAEFEVGNPPGTALPQTGGIGTTLFTALGGLMTATAGAVLTLRRRRQKQSA